MERLLDDALHSRVEQRVSAYLGRAWQIVQVENKEASASHPAAVFTDGDYAVFVKFGEGYLAEDRFQREVTGLRLLAERAGVRTPAAIDIVALEDGALVIMEAVQETPRTPSHWRHMGRALAQIHACKGNRFGLDTHCYWGDLYQDNTPLADWPEFFWTRRLEPRLRASIASGNLPSAFVPQIENLRARLPQLCGPPVVPSLLHGDAHQNNFLSTAAGPVLIDPAVYYGHPEMDLAYVDFFAPVSDELFQGYREILPLEPGFLARRNLWLIPAWLAMVEVDGPQHLDELHAALRDY